MQSRRNILVTGGAGFIGSNLIRLLINKGFNVICLDNFDPFYDRSIKEQNIRSFIDSNHFTFFEGDVRDVKLLRDIFERIKISMVIHLAAKAGVRPSILYKAEYMDVNVNGTLNILETMKTFMVDKIIFASSSSVYGNNKNLPYSETDNVDFPISPYAASKKAGELLTHTFHHLDNFSVINLRFFTVYGPQQRPDLAIHKFFKSIYSNMPVDIYGDGTTSRDYTYVDDIVNGILGALECLEESKNTYETINIGNSNPIMLMDLLDMIEEVTTKKFIRNYLPLQAGDVNSTYADISKAKSIISYRPAISIKEGLLRFKNWFEENNR